MIDRPDIGFDEATHSYTVDGVPVPGCSTVAKIGADSFSPGAWWGYRLGIEAAIAASLDGFIADDLNDAVASCRATGIDPNSRRDSAGDRGTSVHDALEKLAQEDRVPDPADYPENERGHVLSLIRWYLHYRPEFVATEVMVGSRKHGFAGRYDLRAEIRGLGLCLVDLKTSKRTYPETHFAQLEGYEVASVEMGFPATDGRWLLRTSEDGSFVPHDARPPQKWPEVNFVESWGGPGLFLSYLAAFKAREALERMDPERVWRRDCERVLLDELRRGGPALSKTLATVPAVRALGLDSRGVGFTLGRLRKAGAPVDQRSGRWAVAA